MTERIPQSTAKTVVFKAYLASDHVTEATGKTIAITISKNGAAFGNPNVGALNATEISSGWYKVALDTTDTGSLGPLAIRGAVALIDDVGVLVEVVSATSGGYTNLDAAVTTRMATFTPLTAAQIATGVWTDTTAGDFTTALSVGKSVMNGVSLGTGLTVATVTNQLTAAQIATGVWTDTTAGDFTTALSVGKSVMNGVALGTGLTVNTVTNQLTAAAIATGVWTDTTAGDFTTALSVGKSVMNGVALGTGLTVNDITTNTGYALTSGERNSIADAMLDRDMSTGADNGSTTVRTVRQALRFLRNKWAIAAGTLTVYKEDDSTSSWTSTISTDATAIPIIGTDPAGP